MNMQDLLKLLGQKYPTDFTNGMNPAILVFDDGSGRILKDAAESAYPYSSNVLYEFHNMDELIAHLRKDTQMELFPLEQQYTIPRN